MQEEIELETPKKWNMKKLRKKKEGSCVWERGHILQAAELHNGIVEEGKKKEGIGEELMKEQKEENKKLRHRNIYFGRN